MGSKYQMLQSLPFYCRTSFCELLILLLFHFSMIVGAVCSSVCLLLNICCSDISTSFKPSVLSLFSSSYGFLGIQKVKYQNEEEKNFGICKKNNKVGNFTLNS